VFTLRVLGAVRDVPPAVWNALAAEAAPFLAWEWLATLEDAGCVAPETGWMPQHLTLWEGDRLVGACPLYVKGHSLGEFVFDQGWAAAAARAGIAYYPKLLVAVPFTPVAGPRFLAAPEARAAVADRLARVIEERCAARGLSSAHVNFCQPEDARALHARGWLRRDGYQYQWENPGFAKFDDYLRSLRSKRRNQVLRELRELEAQGVSISAHVGDDIPEAVWPALFACYRATIAQLPWGQQYLNARFFELIGDRFRRHLCLIVARERESIIAATFNVEQGGVLYGRYWGALKPLRHLHFNVCYYAAIRHAIEHRLRRFEPGAGGEFKQLRGFDPRPTVSMHLVRDPRLRAGVAEYLVEERRRVAREMRWLGEQTALRRDAGR
jgi:hypothetical protein